MCKCGNTIAEGYKFCPNCGDQVDQPDGTVAKAAGAQPGTVGGAATADDTIDPEEYDAAIEALGTLAKSNAALSEQIEYVDDDEPGDAPNTQPQPNMAKSVTGEGSQAGSDDGAAPASAGEGAAQGSDELFDAFPIVAALFKAVNAQAARLEAFGREIRAMRRDQAPLAKAHAALMGEHKRLSETIQAWGDAPAGRRGQVAGARPVQTLNKSLPGQTQQAAGPAAGEVFAKALQAQKDGILTAHDVGRLNSYVNNRMSLGAIAQADPDLGVKLPRVFPELAAA